MANWDILFETYFVYELLYNILCWGIFEISTFRIFPNQFIDARNNTISDSSQLKIELQFPSYIHFNLLQPIIHYFYPSDLSFYLSSICISENGITLKSVCLCFSFNDRHLLKLRNVYHVLPLLHWTHIKIEYFHECHDDWNK